MILYLHVVLDRHWKNCSSVFMWHVGCYLIVYLIRASCSRGGADRPISARQVPIFELLRKFDGARLQDDIKAGRRRYRLTRLPAFLVLHVKRFTKNNFFLEKNPTIVNFPVRNLELRDIVPVPSGAPATSTSTPL